MLPMHRMVPMGGVAFTFMFWARFDQRQRAGDLLESGVGIRRMMGKAEGVRIKSPQAGELLTESALIVAISGNIGVVVASGISSSSDQRPRSQTRLAEGWPRLSGSRMSPVTVCTSRSSIRCVLLVARTRHRTR